MFENLRHGAARYSVFPSELGDFSIASSGTTSDLVYLSGGQFRPSVASPAVIGTPLANHVLHVLCVSPYEQMTRVDALRRVAGVAHLKGLRDWPMKVFVQPAVSASDSGSSWVKAPI